MGVGKGGGGQGRAMAPPEFSRTLSKTSQISKNLPFLVVNTGSILIGPPLKNFLPTPLPTVVLAGRTKLRVSKNFFGGYLFVFIEYLCNRSPKIKTKNIKNYSSILSIVNHRNLLDHSPPLIYCVNYYL